MPGSPADADRSPVDAAGSPADPEGSLTVPVSVYLWFADLALGAMAGIVGQLGDELANTVPPLAGANSPFAILTHCLGVTEYWAGAAVAGRPVRRDRASEFTASGDVAGLLDRTDAARRCLRDDLSGLDALSLPTNVVRDPEEPVPYTETRGAVLVHILEELFQHLGQMEITRDMLQAQQ
jgi:hypothetical protein